MFYSFHYYWKWCIGYFSALLLPAMASAGETQIQVETLQVEEVMRLVSEHPLEASLSHSSVEEARADVTEARAFLSGYSVESVIVSPAFDASPNLENRLRLSLVLPGQRNVAIRASEAKLQIAQTEQRWQCDQRLAIALETYFRALHRRDLLMAEQKLVANLEKLRLSTLKARKTGHISTFDANQADVEILKATARIGQMHAELEVMLEILKLQLHLTSLTTEQLPLLEVPVWHHTFADVSKLVESHPEMVELRQRAAGAMVDQQAARRGALPQPSLAVGALRADGLRILETGVELEFAPIRVSQASLREAKSTRKKWETLQKLKWLELSSGVQCAMRVFAAALQKEALLRQALDWQNRNNILAQYALEAGEMSLDRFLSAQNAGLSTVQETLDARLNACLAWIDLQLNSGIFEVPHETN